MKRKIALVSMLLICLAISASGTLAYFTAEEYAHNVITTGGISIEIVEKTKDSSGAEVDFPAGGISGVMPGDSVTKIVKIKNTGASEAWVRIRMDRSIDLVDSPAGAQTDLSLILLDIDEENWTLRTESGVEYYYYNDSLEPGEITVPLFTTVTFKGPEMGNLYQNSSFYIDLNAQAVQSENNGASPLEAAGWPTT